VDAKAPAARKLRIPVAQKEDNEELNIIEKDADIPVFIGGNHKFGAIMVSENRSEKQKKFKTQNLY
jgi:arginase family enzyme